MADIVDTDQTQHSAVFDLGLHCLFRIVCPNRSVAAQRLVQWPMVLEIHVQVVKDPTIAAKSLLSGHLMRAIVK